MTDAGREPVDLASLHAADALFDRLATRTYDTSAENDSIVGLLRALLEDVDGRPDTKLTTPSQRGNNRRAACATAAMGMDAAVLASTGVAAAAGGWIEPTPKQASVHSSKPASTKPAQPQENPARHVPGGRLTKSMPNTTCPLVLVAESVKNSHPPRSEGIVMSGRPSHPCIYRWIQAEPVSRCGRD